MAKHYVLLLLVLSSLLLPSAADNSRTHSSLQGNQPTSGQAMGEEGSDGQEQGTFVSSQLFIFLVCLLAFNLLIFVIVYCCVPCIRLRFKVDLNQPRTTKSSRFPHISNFETHSHCLIQSEKFSSEGCFQKEETICELPAFIYGKQNEPAESSVNFLVTKHCERCKAMTHSIEIFKFGKVRQCCEVLFMLLISPCFLAFTIRSITTNGIIWRKIFCMVCGLEKRKKNPE